MILLDTHVFLWLETARLRLARPILEMLENPDTDRLLSASSSWEIAVKYALGKLALPQPPPVYVPLRMERGIIRGLPVSHIHALEVATLPLHHRDPFDRLLIAQARIEGLAILTADRRFQPYDVEVMWAN